MRLRTERRFGRRRRLTAACDNPLDWNTSPSLSHHPQSASTQPAQTQRAGHDKLPLRDIHGGDLRVCTQDPDISVRLARTLSRSQDVDPMSLRMVSWRSLALGWCALFLVSLWSTGAHAYIPAVAVNDTLPTTDNSSLWISWDSGETTEDVSYQLVGADSTGISQVRSRVSALSISGTRF